MKRTDRIVVNLVKSHFYNLGLSRCASWFFNPQLFIITSCWNDRMPTAPRTFAGHRQCFSRLPILNAFATEFSLNRGMARPALFPIPLRGFIPGLFFEPRPQPQEHSPDPDPDKFDGGGGKTPLLPSGRAKAPPELAKSKPKNSRLFQSEGTFQSLRRWSLRRLQRKNLRSKRSDFLLPGGLNP